MGSIRKQSIISSFIVYIGFALGFLNTYLFTIEGGFTQEEYGLTGVFIAIANIMLSFANLGMLAYVYKFFPYYKAHLNPPENDMFSISLLVSVTGFLMVMLTGYFFKDFVVQKYATHSPQLIKYYYYLFPFGFGLTLYSLLEAFAWQFKQSVLTSFMREVLFRLLTTILIVLCYTNIIESFDLFIKIYAFTYLLVAGCLGFYLFYTKKIYLAPIWSKVTRRYLKKIITLCAFIWSGSLVFNIAQFFDTLVIASVVEDGLKAAAVYTLTQNMGSLIQAPQRGLQAAALPHISQAWKDKDLTKLQLIYQRSSINQLLFAIGMFALIWLNFSDGIITFRMKSGYLDAQYVFLFIGLMRIIEMGAGLNAQIISTSVYWRFEFFTGLILLAIALPLNYILAKSIGTVGPAISNLIAFTIYNFIRFRFLYRRFGLQPFSKQTFYTLLAGVIAFLICYYLYSSYQGLIWLAARSFTFIMLFAGAAYYMKLSPDLQAIIERVLNRFRS